MSAGLPGNFPGTLPVDYPKTGYYSTDKELFELLKTEDKDRINQWLANNNDRDCPTTNIDDFIFVDVETTYLDAVVYLMSNKEEWFKIPHYSVHSSLLPFIEGLGYKVEYFNESMKV
jgi:uncharacterized protein YprB with RNaseH-like and TPR domain